MLADRAGLPLETIELYEAGDGGLSSSEQAALGKALSAGVIAIPAAQAGEGVRLRQSSSAWLGRVQPVPVITSHPQNEEDGSDVEFG